MVNLDLAEELIESSKHRRGLRRGPTLVMLGLGLLLGGWLANPSLFASGQIPGWIWPHVVLLSLAMFMLRIVRRQQRRARLMQRAFESVQLQAWEDVEDALVTLLRQPIRMRHARTESLLALAAVAEAQRQLDAAQRIYETLLEERQGTALQAHTAEVALAGLMLKTGQVADAVDMTDRLERQDAPEPLRAQVEMLSLYREVVMGQAAERIDRAQSRRELFRRYLGTRAGYGYGLLAAAFDHAKRPAEAQKFWRDATLLVRARELVERFEELAPVSNRYEAAEFVV